MVDLVYFTLAHLRAGSGQVNIPKGTKDDRCEVSLGAAEWKGGREEGAGAGAGPMHPAISNSPHLDSHGSPNVPHAFQPTNSTGCDAVLSYLPGTRRWPTRTTWRM